MTALYTIALDYRDAAEALESMAGDDVPGAKLTRSQRLDISA